jgi:hypothetical protein
MITTHRISKELRERLPGLLLLALTLGVYWQVKDFGFIYFDDPEYILQNKNIQEGLTWESISWAFTSFYFSNWHPLTWLSYMLDYRLFRLNPAGYHLVNVFFHSANVLLLFLFLRETTGSLWRSFLVAALFGLHPLHVESVAWISERKDVLSAFFWMLTILAYARYSVQKKQGWYWAALLFFALGLMSKPMLVTIPMVLLLLDYWPLNRFSSTDNRGGEGKGYLFLEKIPFLLLSIVSSFVTYVAQTRGGAVQSFESFPFEIRILNASSACLSYLVKMVWPENLTVFYPHPGLNFELWQGVCAALALLALSYGIYRHRRTKPFLAVGWLWYLGTLVPVIGIVQVGAQSMADRYTYIPLIGIFLALVWLIPEKPVSKKLLFYIVPAALIVFYALLAWFQLGLWKNSIVLFENNLRVVGENGAAHYILYQEKKSLGDPAESRRHYERALEINPVFLSKMHNKSGYLQANAREFDTAVEEFRRALQIRPDYVNARNNLAIVFAQMKRWDEAIGEFEKVIRLAPENRLARDALRDLLVKQKTATEQKTIR